MSILLPTPSVKTINAFDPSENHNVEFVYTGNQVVRHTAIITDNDTGEVTERTVTSNRLYHTIPADTLQSGRQYTFQIRVYDIDNNQSNLSSPVLFYCFTNPVFQLGKIANPYRASNIILIPTYTQPEGESLRSYQYMLYDNSNNLLKRSDVYYGNTITEHTFDGLENNISYYVQCVGVTEHGMSLDTGKHLVNVIYNTIPANILFKLENHPCSGYISLITNMIDVGYELESENYTFNDDGSLTLYNNSLTYEGGFSIDGDFSLYIDAKELPIGTFLRTRNDNFTLSIVDVCGGYYCEFKCGDYVLYAGLPEAQLVTEDGDLLVNEEGKKIEIINLTYDDDSYVIFEVKRQNNIYNLRAYYRYDA